MSVILFLAVVVFLFGPGVSIFFVGLSEILEERKFRKTGILIEGNVVGKVPVKFPSRDIPGSYGVVASTITPETSGGFFFTIEYKVDREYYSFRPQKVFSEDKEKVEILYNRDNPVDIMVDGFYKVGKQKYYRLISGMVLGVIPFIFYSIWVISNGLIN